MRNVVWLVFTRFGTFALVLLLIWQGYDYFGPQKPEVPEDRKIVADSVVLDVRDDLASLGGDIDTVALLHLANDPSDYVTNALRREIELAGMFDLRDRTFGEKVNEALRLRHEAYGEIEAAVVRGRELGVDGVIFGSVDRFETDSAGARIELTISLADVRSGQVVSRQRYQNDQSGTLAPVAKQISRISWFKRFLTWIILVLMLPVFTIAFLRAKVRQQSNRTNAFTLGLYTFVGAALAYLLLGLRFTGFWPVLLFLILVVAVFFYNVAMMSYAHRLEAD